MATHIGAHTDCANSSDFSYDALFVSAASLPQENHLQKNDLFKASCRNGRLHSAQFFLEQNTFDRFQWQSNKYRSISVEFCHIVIR